MANKTILELNEHYVDVHIKKDEMTTNKVIGYDNLTSLFQQEQNFQTPYLPGEYGLQKFSKVGNREHYLYLEPPREITCKYSVDNGSSATDHIDYDDYEDEDAYEEALEEWRAEHGGSRGYEENQFLSPALLWMISLNKQSDGSYSVRQTNVYALKSPIYTGRERVYRAPFANIYDSGNVCWNEVVVSIPQPKAIQGLSTLFFGGIANTDLDSNRFEYFDREYLKGRASLTLHFQMEINEMLKDESKSNQDVLDYVHSKLNSEGMTVEEAFNNFKSNY